MRTLPALAITLVLGACNVPQDASLPNDLAPTVLANSPEWGPVTEFQDSYDDRTRAIYASAAGTFVANTKTGRMQCSGFMVSPWLFATAAHCVPVLQPWQKSPIIQVHFGYLDTPEEHELIEGLVNKRLHNYSFLASGETWDPLEEGERRFPNFCMHTQTEVDRDIAYFHCEGNRAPNAAAGATWGFLEVGDLRSHKAKEEVWGLSVNDRCKKPHTTLLAPGAYDRTVRCSEDGHTGCFGATFDLESGSSGGAVLDAQHRVFGVQIERNESYYDNFGDWVHWSDERVLDDCDTSPILGTNVSAKFSELLPKLIDEDRRLGAMQGRRTKNTATIGQRPGSSWLLKCPDYMRGVGLVGSSGVNGMVGSLGIICSGSTYQHADALVFAKGAWDTGYVDSNGMSLNAYLAEVRQPEERVPDAKFFGMQTAALCPGNFFLTGVHARRGIYVDSIDKLICAEPAGLYVREVEVGDPELGRIGSSPGGVTAEASCDKGSNLAGLYVWTGDVTDGFTGYCREQVRF